MGKENVEPAADVATPAAAGELPAAAEANLLWLLDFRLDNLLPSDGHAAAADRFAPMEGRSLFFLQFHHQWPSKRVQKRRQSSTIQNSVSGSVPNAPRGVQVSLLEMKEEAEHDLEMGRYSIVFRMAWLIDEVTPKSSS